jgi:hypothetical protein
MAVLRDSQPVGAVAKATAPDIRQSSGGAVKAPNVRKFTDAPSTADLLINSVVKVGTQLAGQAWEVQKEEAYLDGVRQASVIESEADLAASPFTSDWAKAGFRDTQSRIAQAAFTDNLPAAMQDALTKPDPKAAFASYMAAEQSKLVQSYSGTSRKQRAAMFAQNATDLYTAQREFTAAYANDVIQKEEGSLRGTFGALRGQLDRTKDDFKAYEAASNSFASGLYTQVWLNDKLPTANKIALTKEALVYAASSDNTQVYELLKNQQFDFPGGKSGTIMQQLTFDDQIDVDTAQRKAAGRTKSVRAASFEDTMSLQQAEWADKDGPGPTIEYPQLKQQLDIALNEGLIDSGRYGSILKSYHTAKAVNQPNTAMGLAYGSADFPTIVKLGGGQADGLAAWLKLQEGQPFQGTIQGLLGICNAGMGSACTKAGELLQPSIGNLGFSENMDVESAGMVHQFVQAIDQAQVNNPGAYTNMLGGLSSESQDMVLLMREAQREVGISDPLAAASWARQRSTEKTGQEPRLAKAKTKMIEEFESTSFYEVIDRNFGVSSVLRPEQGLWSDDEDRVAAITGTSKVVLAEEFDRISRLSPFLSDSSIQDKAMAAAAARAISTSSGPIFMPEGENIHHYFGAPKIANAGYISKAIDDVIPLEKGQRIEWSRTKLPGAPLAYRITNSEGASVSSGMLDPKSIGARVQDKLDTDAATSSSETGPGKIVSRNGASVQFNGQNTAGFAAGPMLALRDDIVASEGISGTAYGDGKVVKGNKAFGVGISQSGGFFEKPEGAFGAYSQKQIDDSFMKASNGAAETASRVMEGTGLQGTDWLRFFGELAYQSPAAARNPDMLAYIQLGDVDNAVAALQAYKPPSGKGGFEAFGDNRQQVYINKLKKAMKK